MYVVLCTCTCSVYTCTLYINNYNYVKINVWCYIVLVTFLCYSDVTQIRSLRSLLSPWIPNFNNVVYKMAKEQVFNTVLV